MSPKKLLVVVAVVSTCACTRPTERLESGVGTVTILPGTPPIDLRADVNRNGTLELELDAEDTNEDTWEDF